MPFGAPADPFSKTSPALWILPVASFWRSSWRLVRRFLVFGGSGFKSAGVLGQLEKVRSRVQKWCRNGSQIQDFGVSSGGPGGSWGGPGGSRASLRLLGAVLVDVGAVLGPSGTGLGAVLGRLGVLLGRSWGLLDSLGGARGASWGSWMRLGSILAASWGLLGPSWGPLGPQMLGSRILTTVVRFWTILEVPGGSRRPLGGVSGPLGGFLEGSWGLSGASWSVRRPS